MFKGLGSSSMKSPCRNPVVENLLDFSVDRLLESLNNIQAFKNYLLKFTIWSYLGISVEEIQEVLNLTF